MYMNVNLLTLNNELCNLDPKEAVAIFNKLLCLEAISINIPLCNISCPKGDNVTIKDGGIDASISNPFNLSSDLILDKEVRYQIKADSKKPWADATIVKELFNCTLKE